MSPQKSSPRPGAFELKFSQLKEFLDLLTKAAGVVPIVAAIVNSIIAFVSGSILVKLADISKDPLSAYRWLAVLAILLIILSIISAILIFSMNIKVRQFKSQCTVYPHFRAMAASNSECDIELYSALFLGLYQEMAQVDSMAGFISEHVRPNALSSRILCYFNIDAILDTAAAVFTILTGSGCSVALKAREGEKILGLRRDRASKALRTPNDDEPFDIDANSAFKAIVREERPYYRDNNLRANKSYQNGRLGWPDDYNATLVHSIKSNAEPRFHYFLCIDNQSGGFDNEGVLSSSGEICARLAVMIHRALSLEAIIKQTKPLGVIARRTEPRILLKGE